MNDVSVYSLSPEGWLLAIVCALVVGMSKCGMTGLGTLAVPLLASVLPARMSTGALLPMLIMGDAMGVTHFNRHANWKILIRLMPPALAGIFLGYWLLTQPWLNDIVIRKSIGVIVIALLVLSRCRDRIRLDIGDGKRMNAVGLTIAILFGITAGVTTMIANAAGPILLIYLLAMNLPKDEFIGTSAWYFLVLNWCKVPLMMHLGMINRDSMMFNLQLFPAVLVGALLGIALAQKMSNKSYTIWIQALTLVAALKLLF
mgnify:CR=1 FL=1